MHLGISLGEAVRMKKGLFLRKPMKAQFVELDEEHHGLKRHLGAFQLTTIGIGAIIGAGIFVITGQAAAQFAGPGIVLSFVIAALICTLAGLCYAELSALIPVAGGSYSYSYVALGEFPAWIVCWALIAQCLISAATVSVGWSGYFVSLVEDFGVSLSPNLTQAPFIYEAATGWQASGALLNVPAMVIALGLGILILIGIKAATYFNQVMVILKLCTVFFFIVMGLFYIQPDNWVPWIPENTGVVGEFGWSGIFRAAGLVFFAYIGFDTISTLAQDAINPQRDLPRGILSSLFICTAAYIATALVLTGVVHYTLLDVPDPMSVALAAMGARLFWLKLIIKIAILAGLTTVALVQMLGQTRIFLAASRDGLLPQIFCRLHPKSRTPFFATLITTFVTLLIAGLFSVEILGSLVSMSTLFIFAIVCLGVLILRYTHPEFHRPFRVPFVPFIPILGIITCLAQMCFLPSLTWIQMLCWFAVGLITYFVYGIRNSKIRK
jgi:APA family basic amino acid/polyamine antiporter